MIKNISRHHRLSDLVEVDEGSNSFGGEKKDDLNEPLLISFTKDFSSIESALDPESEPPSAIEKFNSPSVDYKMFTSPKKKETHDETQDDMDDSISSDSSSDVSVKSKVNVDKKYKLRFSKGFTSPPSIRNGFENSPDIYPVGLPLGYKYEGSCYNVSYHGVSPSVIIYNKGISKSGHKVDSSWITLENSNEIRIKKLPLLQRDEGLEISKYQIFKIDHVDRRVHLFAAFEESNVCNKQCFGTSRSFNIFLSSSSDDNLFLSLHRETTSCLFGRPVLRVKDTAGNIIGNIVKPMRMSVLEVQIKDGNNELLYTIKASKYAQYIFCGMYNDIYFGIYGPDGEKTNGEIERRLPRRFFSSKFNFLYKILYPSGTSPYHKSLILCAMLFIDVLYFD